MPTINQYTRQNTQSGLLRTQAGAESFGGNVSGLQAVARGADDMAQGFGAASQAVDDYIIRRDQSDYIAQMSKERIDLMKKAEEMANQDFGGKTPAQAYEDFINQRMQEFAESVPRTMRDRFAQDKAQIEQGFIQTGIQETSRREGVKRKANYEQTLISSENMVAIEPSFFDVARQSVAEQVDLMPLAPEDKAALLQETINRLHIARAQGHIARDPYSFIAGANSGEYSDVPDLPRLIESAKSKVKVQIGQNLSMARDRFGAGLPPPSSIDDDIAYARQVGAEDLATEFTTIKELSPFSEEFNKANAIDQIATLIDISTRAEQGEELSPSDIKKYEMGMRFYETKMDAIRQDPLQYYVKVGVVDAVQPLVINESLPEQMNKRREQRQTIMDFEKNLQLNIPLITKEEGAVLSDMYKKGGINERQLMRSSFVQAMNPSELDEFKAVIADNNPQMAALMELEQSAPATAREIDVGLQALKEQTVAPLDSEQKEMIVQKIAEIVPPDQINLAAGMREAIIGQAAYLTAQEGSIPDIDDVIESVIGEKIEINGRPTMTYRRPDGLLLSESDFQDLFKKIDSSVFEEIGTPYINGVEIDPEVFTSEIQLIVAGDGKYLATFNGGLQLQDKEGRPYILDMQKVGEIKGYQYEGFFSKATIKNILKPRKRKSDVTERLQGF